MITVIPQIITRIKVKNPFVKRKMEFKVRYEIFSSDNTRVMKPLVKHMLVFTKSRKQIFKLSQLSQVNDNKELSRKLFILSLLI